MPITTPEELRQHLALAIQVELTTVPPYLYALYSIEDQTSEAARLIKSVVAEEMLHAALVANLLVASRRATRLPRSGYRPDLPGLASPPRAAAPAQSGAGLASVDSGCLHGDRTTGGAGSSAGGR